jgi:hypothetical protein
MPSFHGIHAHASTNAVYEYDGEFDDAGVAVRWVARVRRDGQVVSYVAGATPRSPPAASAEEAVQEALHAMIDAKAGQGSGDA